MLPNLGFGVQHFNCRVSYLDNTSHGAEDAVFAAALAAAAAEDAAEWEGGARARGARTSASAYITEVPEELGREGSARVAAAHGLVVGFFAGALELLGSSVDVGVCAVGVGCCERGASKPR